MIRVLSADFDTVPDYVLFKYEEDGQIIHGSVAEADYMGHYIVIPTRRFDRFHLCIDWRRRDIFARDGDNTSWYVVPTGDLRVPEKAKKIIRNLPEWF